MRARQLRKIARLVLEIEARKVVASAGRHRKAVGEVEGVGEIDADIIVRRRQPARNHIVRGGHHEVRTKSCDRKISAGKKAELAARGVCHAAMVVARTKQELIVQSEQFRLVNALDRTAKAVGVLARAVETAKLLEVDTIHLAADNWNRVAVGVENLLVVLLEAERAGRAPSHASPSAILPSSCFCLKCRK